MQKPDYSAYNIVFLKRLFDVLVSAFILLVFSPIFVLIIVLIFIESSLRGKPFGSIFYVEQRISQGSAFHIIKFNIFKQEVIDEMRKNNEFIHTKDLEKNGSLKIIGYVLKQIYMDELPQLFNVLRGDMSLVGPRPLNLEVYMNLKERGLATQEFLRAGLTGNFQSYKNLKNKTSEELDKKYLEYYTTHNQFQIVLFDIGIILRTIKVLLRAQGV